MSDLVICAEGVGKMYEATRRRGLFDLRERLVSWGMRRKAAPSPEEGVWALKEVCLSIRRGEVVGIMGRNGSGKTTLMKILARITEPTEGTAAIRGQVGTLLDVGAGLHGELSGRENIYLNAAIHGMQRDEIRSQLDEIIAFAELEYSIDRPLKYFSSGMCLRLAFTVASFLRSSVLLVDEVLGQADPRFQQKCLKRMTSLAMGGQTVLIVSHDLECLRTFCTRGLVVSAGRVVHDGTMSRMAHFVRPTGIVSDQRERPVQEFAEQAVWKSR